MAERLRAAAAGHGFSADEIEGLLRAHGRAMEPRRRGVPDEHDFRYLHPGRTALVLLEDGGWADPLDAMAAALVESEDGELAVERASIGRVLGEEVAGRVDAVPVPAGVRDGAELLEALVTAPRGAQLVALAERLDHLRHLHVRVRRWGDREGAGRSARQARDIYLPLARRVGGTLERRFDWWCRRVGRRWE